MLASIHSVYDRAISLIQKVAWIGPLLVRITLGLVFVTTGWGKLHSLDKVTEFFASLNIPAPGIQAAFVSTIEFAGGILLMFGLGTRIVSALLVGVMAVAIWTVKLPDPEVHGLVGLAGTDELAYLVMFVWLVVAGAGTASLDRLVGHLIGRREPSEPRVGVAP
jgi:putative oxidoreductase